MLRSDLTQPLYHAAVRTAKRAVVMRWLTYDAVPSGDKGRALLAARADVFLHALGGRMDTGPIADWPISLRQTAILAQQHLATIDPDAVQLAELQRRVADLRQQLRAILESDHRLTQHLRAQPGPFDKTIDLPGEVTLNLFAGTETTVASVCWALGILARRPVQQDQMIALPIVGQHHNDRLWSRPHQFDADRTAFVDDTYHRRAYLPFSAGLRVCGGLDPGRAQIAIALTHVLTRYRIAPIVTPIRYEYSLTLRPLGTSRLRFERRNCVKLAFDRSTRPTGVAWSQN